MRLLAVRPTYFRGCGDTGWLNLDSDLVLLYGPNAFGKTSFAEAIEWLLYGKTSRRAKGESYWRDEYSGSYRNAHAPEGSPTNVTARVRLSDGAECEIERRLIIGQRGADHESETYVDGGLASFASIGLTPDESLCPIIVQHGLQDFIFTRPIDRRDAVSAALGLDSVIVFKRALEKARNALRNYPPPSVAESLSVCQALGTSLAHCPTLADVLRRWSSGSFDVVADDSRLREACLQTLGADEREQSWREIRDGLAQLRQRVTATIFDNSSIRAVDSAVVEQASAAELAYSTAAKGLKEAAADFLAVTTATYGLELLRFWDAGLRLADPEHPARCPMCEAETFPIEKRHELARRVEQNRAYQESLGRLQEKAQAARRTIHGAQGTVQSLFPAFLDEGARKKLQSVTLRAEDASAAFLTSHDRAQKARDESQRALDSLEHSLLTAVDCLEKRQNTDAALAFAEQFGDSLVKSIVAARQAAGVYTSAFGSFEPLLAQSIASQESVRQVDALVGLIDDWRHVVVRHTYERLLQDVQVEMRDAERFLQQKQAEIISARGEEIKGWYSLMNPGACVTFAEMEPATDAIKLHADTFGRRVAAASWPLWPLRGQRTTTILQAFPEIGLTLQPRVVICRKRCRFPQPQ